MKILITAGPTREAIDPVRYISNRSSGKMGYAIAEAAVAAGHEVILISGPVALSAPEQAHLTQVTTAEEMYAAVANQIGEQVDLAVFCAAVADYRPVEAAEQKIKKSHAEQMTLVLEKTRDILANVRGKMNFPGLLVGFAAETNDLEKHARDKLSKKKCDLIVANLVNDPETGFDVDENELQLFYADGQSEKMPRQTKTLLAEKLIEIFAKLGEARS
ncbi:MAG: bifunctional phosphopantothenoylcysteine decarboxylase/phosphopantothenate--cysteine ligase CoaBC [Verrucomicrobiota bacterium]